MLFLKDCKITRLRANIQMKPDAILESKQLYKLLMMRAITHILYKSVDNSCFGAEMKWKQG
jgi:hypothetical protein